MQADTVVTTESCALSQIQELCNLIEQEDYTLAAPVYMPLISDY